MSISVKDILHTSMFEDAVVLSGNHGLDKTVQRIASIERPFTDHPEYSYHVAKPGDLYVSKLFVFDGSIEKLHEELEFQRQTKGCGLITHKEMIPFFDDKAIEMSNAYGLPIIAIDNAIGFTELIFSVTDLIIKDNAMQIYVKHFENLLQSNLAKEDVEKNIISMGWEIQNNIRCVFLNTGKEMSPSRYSIEDSDVLLPIYHGLAYVISDTDEREIHKREQRFIEYVKATQEQYHIGVSSINVGFGNMKTAVLEALYAYVFCRNMRKTVMHYDALGIFSLLSGLEQQDSMKKFKDVFYEKIKGFDSDGKLELEKIIELFIISGGDFKFVSDEMYLHEATVRYRMNKLKGQLKYNNHNDLYADIKMAVYASWIVDDSMLQLVRW